MKMGKKSKNTRDERGRILENELETKNLLERLFWKFLLRKF